jgi:hypothetical protein
MNKNILLMALGLMVLGAFIWLIWQGQREIAEPPGASRRLNPLEDERQEVSVTLRDRLYHLSTCPNLEGEETERMKLKEAIREDYRPCPVCLGKHAPNQNALELADNNSKHSNEDR